MRDGSSLRRHRAARVVFTVAVSASAFLAAASCANLLGLDSASVRDSGDTDGTDAIDAADAALQPSFNCGDSGNQMYCEAVLADKPVAYFQFENCEGAGTEGDPGTCSVVDTSGHNALLAATGMSVPGVAGRGFRLSSGSMMSLLYAFSALDGDVEDSAPMGRMPFTVEAWYNQDVAADGRGTIFSTRPGEGASGFDFFVNAAPLDGSTPSYPNVGLQLYFSDGSTPDTYAKFPVGRFKHIVITFDSGGDGLVYVNGDVNGCPQDSPVHDASVVGFSSVGSAFSANGAGLNGILDEVAIYAAALDGESISRHYVAGLAQLASGAGDP